MPPKVVGRRPAARVGRLRRPAARVEPPAEEEKKCLSLGLGDLGSLGYIHLKKARYYGREVELVGKFTNLGLEDGQPMGTFEASGTQDDALLRLLSGRPKRQLTVHLCQEDCPGALTDAFLVHGRSFIKVDQGKDPWFTNLLSVGAPAGEADELEALRADETRRKQERERGDDKPPKAAEKVKKADKKQKRREEEDSQRKRRRSESEDEWEIGQKSPKLLFEKTGLDPEARQRRKFLKKARKVGRSKKSKKKKSKSSSSASRSSSSETVSSGPVASVGLFDNERKLGTIWKRFPGALACSAATEAKQHLLTAAGTVWGLDRKKVDPVFTHYARQCLMGHMSPPMAQEALTVAQTLDMMLQGHVAGACDLMAQRLKSLESSSRGNHWTVSRQMELVRSDGGTMAEEAETVEAAKRAREEERLRSLTARPSGTRSTEALGGGKGSRKGKDWKGANKGKGDESAKGKGSDRRDDGKTWQKEKK